MTAKTKRKAKPPMDLESEVALEGVIWRWPMVTVVVDYGKPVLNFWALKKSKERDCCEIDKMIATLDLRKVIAKRQNLKGITKRLKKAIRPGRAK